MGEVAEDEGDEEEERGGREDVAREEGLGERGGREGVQAPEREAPACSRDA